MPVSNTELVVSWDSSYDRNENNVLEPYEELVKFLSRFVFDRNSRDASLSLKNDFFGKNISDIRCIDIGCGVGGQSQYLASKGFLVHGYDVSNIAISRAKERIANLGLQASVTFSVVDPTDFEICKNFDIGVACASLDSMPFDCAVEWIVKAGKACASGGLFFATIIGPSLVGDALQEEVITDQIHEAGTVQSYFDREKIEDLFSRGNFSILRLDLIETSTLIPTGIKPRSSGRYSIVARQNI